jgi:hypothetical protein
VARVDKSQHHAQRSRLSRSVGAKKPVYATPWNAEAESRDCIDGPKALRQIMRFENGSRLARVPTDEIATGPLRRDRPPRVGPDPSGQASDPIRAYRD